MKEMELNKKLAEWAGFVEAEIKKHYYWTVGGERVAKWIEPDRDYGIKLPNFTSSLDACFEWLVPKLQDKGNQVELLAFEHMGYMATIYKDCFSRRGSDGYDPFLEPISQVRDDNPALALCLAIEKLIDSMENK